MQGEAEAFLVSPEEAQRLIAAHDGDITLLWLFLRQRPGSTLEDAARALCRTRAELEAAYEKLQRLSLPAVKAAPAAAPAGKKTGPSLPVPEPAHELPQYTSEDLVQRSQEDARWTALLTEAQRALGRKLNSGEMKTLFGLYDYLALPPEVLMMLLNYCVANAPSGNSPSMRFIEKEGYAWANREILTLEQAEEYIAASQRRREKLSRTAKILGINGRALTNTEAKYLGAWLDMGFDDEMIGMAYDRTVTNTGALKWSYMNGILKSWHEKGLHTPEAVREKDTRRPRGQAGKQEAPRDMDKLLAALEKL